MKDKSIIACPTGWLSDSIIDGAQKLLKHLNPTMSGLQNVCQASALAFDIQRSEFVQVSYVDSI